MIQKLSHVSIFCLDQDVAHDFYVTKLGFDVKTDAKMDNGFRWLTVSPPGQPDLEIVLMPVDSPFSEPEKSAILRKAVEAGVLGGGVFDTPDCWKTYEDLKARGVEFKSEPQDQFYGIEAVLKDPFGNWFSMTQRKGE